MQPKAFGEKLKYYRRQAQDKQGIYLTQTRLADLINDYFGLSSFPSQYISHWEQGKYLPRDREMLQALVYILMTCRGINSIEKANEWLNLGGYASLSEQKIVTIWGKLPKDELLEKLHHPTTQTSTILTIPSNRHLNQLQQKLTLIKTLTKCSLLQDLETRNLIVNQLSFGTNIQRHQATKIDLNHIINACLKYTNGMEELLELVQFYEGDSLAMCKVLEIWQKWQR